MDCIKDLITSLWLLSEKYTPSGKEEKAAIAFGIKHSPYVGSLKVIYRNDSVKCFLTDPSIRATPM